MQHEWRANPGQQERFLRADFDEVLYGGAAGGGKSEALLMDAARYVTQKEYWAIIFRREYPELELTLIPRSYQWFPHAGGRYNQDRRTWRFPSGARISFGHVEHDADVFQYQSAEFQYLGFDELTTFTEFQYTYLRSRARSSAGIPVRIRAGTNPGGVGHDWVQRRFAPWLGMPPGEKYDGPLAEPNQPLWYVSLGDGTDRWLSNEEAREMKLRWEAAPPREQLDLPNPMTRVFIPARVEDNPRLYEHDPAYVARLRGLDKVSSARLLRGDWIIRPARGLYFQRAWCGMVPMRPSGGRMVRYWDLAGTEVTKVKGEKRAKDPDWTVGCLLHLQEEGPAKGRLTVCDVVRMRGNPGEVLDCVKATAVRDGKEVPIWIGQDPGQAGKFEIVAYESELRGWQVWGYKETGDKITRAGPVSAHALHGQVDIVSAPWNGAFFSVLEEFPEGPHDDDMDALSGGYAVLTESPPPSYGEMPAKDISRPWSRLGYQAPRR